MNYSFGYNLGMLAAVLVGVLVGVGIIALLFKLKVMDLTFDERQERARGQAYKYGFWTLLTCLLLTAFPTWSWAAGAMSSPASCCASPRR